MHSGRPYRILRFSSVGECDPAADNTYTAAFGMTASYMEEADRLLQSKHVSTCSVPLHPF